MENMDIKEVLDKYQKYPDEDIESEKADLRRKERNNYHV